MDLGFPIGLEENIGDFVSSIDVPFQEGDMMVLYSDGITEAESEIRRVVRNGSLDRIRPFGIIRSPPPRSLLQ